MSVFFSRFIISALLLPAVSVPVAAFAAETPKTFLTDAALTTKVRAALLSDTALEAKRIAVRTKNHIVELSGQVDTASQEAEAVRVATEINGVKLVQNKLSVAGTGSPRSEP